MDYLKVRNELCVLFIVAILFSAIAGTVFIAGATETGYEAGFVQEFVLPQIDGQLTITSIVRIGKIGKYASNFLLPLFLIAGLLQVLGSYLLSMVSNRGSTKYKQMVRAGTPGSLCYYQLE